MASLSSPRELVTSIIAALTEQSTNPSNHHGHQLASHKNHLLTLHVLFSNELLPALDLLDRGIVTRFTLAQPNLEPPIDTDNSSTPTTSIPPPSPHIYYVRSARTPTSRVSNSRFRNAGYDSTTYYEVRLKAWTCSCPAFTFAAFPPVASKSSDSSASRNPGSTYERKACFFGGLTTGGDMPMCKHLLACALVEHSPAFAHLVEEKFVSLEELAGWAAGWGD